MSYNQGSLILEDPQKKPGQYARLAQYNQFGFDRLGRLAPLTMSSNPFFQYTIQPPAVYVRPVYGGVGYNSLSGNSFQQAYNDGNYFSLANAYDRF
jgi:hypothetical protein